MHGVEVHGVDTHEVEAPKVGIHEANHMDDGAPNDYEFMIRYSPSLALSISEIRCFAFAILPSLDGSSVVVSITMIYGLAEWLR